VPRVEGATRRVTRLESASTLLILEKPNMPRSRLLLILSEIAARRDNYAETEALAYVVGGRRTRRV